jgi:hypothetical protein
MSGKKSFDDLSFVNDIDEYWEESIRDYDEKQKEKALKESLESFRKYAEMITNSKSV